MRILYLVAQRYGNTPNDTSPYLTASESPKFGVASSR